MMTNLRNLFYQWHMGNGHMHHDGTVWRSIEELRSAMAWSTPHVEMRWENLGLVQPNWCCSRCLRRGAALPDHYVTREGAMRMLMEQPQECEGFWGDSALPVRRGQPGGAGPPPTGVQRHRGDCGPGPDLP